MGPPEGVALAFCFSKRRVPLAVWPWPMARRVGASQEAASRGMGVWIDWRVSTRAGGGPSGRWGGGRRGGAWAMGGVAGVVSRGGGSSGRGGGAWLAGRFRVGVLGWSRPWNRERFIRDSEIG